MQHTLHFKVCLITLSLLLISSLNFADIDKIHDLEKRLAIEPPTKEDYVPIREKVSSLISAIRYHDYERAYFFYTSKQFRQATSYSDFKQFIEANRVLHNNKSISSTDLRIDRNVAYYKGVISSNDGSQRNIQFQLVLEDGSWKIHGVQIQRN